MPAWSHAGDAVRPHRFTVADVDRMAESGVLDPDERVELLDGELVDVSPQGPEHAWSGEDLHRALREAYGPAYQVRGQRPLELGVRSRPEPDVAVVRGGRDAFRHAHPTGHDAVLVVEVAASSQDVDRDKAALYAAGGVPVYWLLDVVGRTLEVHTDPTPDGYATTVALDEPDTVALPDLGIRLRVGDLLP